VQRKVKEDESTHPLLGHTLGSCCAVAASGRDYFQMDRCTECTPTLGRPKKSRGVLGGQLLSKDEARRIAAKQSRDAKVNSAVDNGRTKGVISHATQHNNDADE
jgi:hypothetical protein